jgi:hypothetical protein
LNYFLQEYYTESQLVYFKINTSISVASFKPFHVGSRKELVKREQKELMKNLCLELYKN